jgi:RNA polymerase sigma factor (sigma-70 family)
MVLGPFTAGWECGSRYLLHLAEATQALEGQPLRQAWREGLRRQALVGWIEEELTQQAGLDGDEARLFLSLAGGVDRDAMGLTVQGREELQHLLEEWAERDPVLMCEAGVIFLLNRPRSRALLPWIPWDPEKVPYGRKLRVAPEDLAYKTTWGADFFKALAAQGQLSQTDQIQAAQAIAQDPESPWAWRLVASVHWSVERIALGILRPGGPDLEDLIQEGLLGAHRAALRYKPFDAGGGFAPFHLYAWRWIWQFVNLYAQEQAPQVRRPLKHHEDWQEAPDAPGWEDEMSEDLPPWFCLSPVVGLDDELVAPTVWGPRVADVLLGQDAGFDAGTETISELIPPDLDKEPRLNEGDLLKILRPLLSHPTLNRDFDLLASHFGLLGREPRTLEEVGASLNPPISRERVRQREARFIERINSVPGIQAQLRGFYDNTWAWETLARPDRMQALKRPRKPWTRHTHPQGPDAHPNAAIPVPSEVTDRLGMAAQDPLANRSFSILDPTPA